MKIQSAKVYEAVKVVGAKLEHYIQARKGIEISFSKGLLKIAGKGVGVNGVKYVPVSNICELEPLDPEEKQD